MTLSTRYAGTVAFVGIASSPIPFLIIVVGSSQGCTLSVCPLERNHSK